MMEVDFDKQIDTILRDLAKGNSIAETPQKSHLDADEISAFAENVVPAKSRLRMTQHLADCSRCRNVLAAFVSLSAEEESENIHEEVKTIAAIPPVPWYRKLFIFPQLAYTMGAFVLLLSGMVGYIVFQNSYFTADVAQIDKTNSEQVKGPGGPSSESGESYKETYVGNSANSAANTSVPSPTVSANSAPAANVATVPEKAEEIPSPTPSVSGYSNEPPASAPVATERPADDEKVADKEVVAKKGGDQTVGKSPETEQQPVNEVTDNISRQQVQESNIQNNRDRGQVMMPDGGGQPRRNMPSPPPQVTKSAPRREVERPRSSENKDDDSKTEVVKNKTVVTKTIGDKVFENRNGVWTDTKYKSGDTKTIKRGSKDYKKLDSGLQNIGNSFSETVIVVWNGKNYKIQ